MKKILGRWRMRGVLFWVLMFGMISTWMVFGMVSAGGVGVRAEEQPKLAVMPFFIERIENPDRGAVLCPLCSGVFKSGEVVSGSQNLLTRLLYTKIDILGRFKIIPQEKTEETLSPVVRQRFDEKPIPTALQIGKDLGADFLLVGFLFRFEERIGSSLGVDKPASVGYDLHLLRLRDGRVVWTGRFDETQRPLSENLFKIGSFFRRKATWLTAGELAGVGMDEMLKRLPGIKELEEGS